MQLVVWVQQYSGREHLYCQYAAHAYWSQDKCHSTTAFVACIFRVQKKLGVQKKSVHFENTKPQKSYQISQTDLSSPLIHLQGMLNWILYFGWNLQGPVISVCATTIGPRPFPFLQKNYLRSFLRGVRWPAAQDRLLGACERDERTQAKHYGGMREDTEFAPSTILLGHFMIPNGLNPLHNYQEGKVF